MAKERMLFLGAYRDENSSIFKLRIIVGVDVIKLIFSYAFPV